MAAAQRLLVEGTLCDGFLKSRTLHFIHMDWAHALQKKKEKKVFENDITLNTRVDIGRVDKKETQLRIVTSGMPGAKRFSSFML